MTTVNIIPLASWISYLWIVYRKNEITILRLHLLKYSQLYFNYNNNDSNISINEQNEKIKKEENQEQKQNTIDLSKKELEMLDNMTEEIKCLKLLGMKQEYHLQQLNDEIWKTIWT